MVWLPDHVWLAQKKGKGKGKGGDNGGVLKVLQALIGGGGGGSWGGGGGGSWGKGKGKGKGRGRNASNMGIVSGNAKTSPEKVAWIGGLKEKESGTGEEYKEINRKLKAHIEKKTGVGCKFVNITKKGQGGAVFGSEEEAQAAIAAVNGTKFMGSTLEVDVWTKKEKD